MRRASLIPLQCPGCRSAYRAVVHVEDEHGVEMGYLTCHCRALVVPIVRGFVFFDKPLLGASQAGLAQLQSMALAVFGSDTDYQQHVERKMSRGAVEIYAAFQPFNESTRALDPLLPQMRSVLRPGDVILDAYCRTGWSGEWLAGTFPHQHVIALWEGDSSVLGYRGYCHLLGSGQRAANLDVMFIDRAAPLPFADRCVGLLHGHDALHRRPWYPFIADALRVTRPDAALVFPHVHLANAEPEPFFERGGRIVHGNAYRGWLDELNLMPARRGWVFSEATLFERSLVDSDGGVEHDEAATSHYNGLVAILPQARAQAAAFGDDLPLRLLVNPLLSVDLVRKSVRVAAEGFHGEVDKLLRRHPIYRRRLPAGALPLTEEQCLAIVLSAAGVEESALCAVTASMEHCIDELQRCEVLRRAAVSSGAHRLQRYHAHQWPVSGASNFAERLLELAARDADFAMDAQGARITAADASEFMRRVPGCLTRLSIAPDMPLELSSLKNPLIALAACAAAAAGWRVRVGASGPTDSGVSPEEWLATMEHVTPADVGQFDVAGRIELTVGDGVSTVPLLGAIAGLAHLERQLARRLLLVDAQTSEWDDLLSVLMGLISGETVRYGV